MAEQTASFIFLFGVCRKAAEKATQSSLTAFLCHCLSLSCSCHPSVVVCYKKTFWGLFVFFFKSRIRIFPCYETGLDFFCIYVKWVKLQTLSFMN